MDQKINVLPQNIKLSEENIGGNFHDFEFDSNTFVMTPKAQATEEKIDKMDFIEMKNLYMKKYYQVTDNLQNWRIYLKIIYLIRH